MRSAILSEMPGFPLVLVRLHQYVADIYVALIVSDSKLDVAAFGVDQESFTVILLAFELDPVVAQHDRQSDGVILPARTGMIIIGVQRVPIRFLESLILSPIFPSLAAERPRVPAVRKRLNGE